MPYIDIKTTVPVSGDMEAALFKALGKAIEIFPGKTEKWLMLNVTGEQKMCFAGDAKQPCLFADVRIFGNPNAKAAEAMTQALCGIFEEVLNIPADRSYICYKGYDTWGWNNMNF